MDLSFNEIENEADITPILNQEKIEQNSSYLDRRSSGFIISFDQKIMKLTLQCHSALRIRRRLPSR